MQEIFPIASGVVIALLTWRLAPPRWQGPLLAVLALIFGFLASLTSGELAVSWGFVSVDTALVLLAAVLTLIALNVWQRRAATASHGHN